MNVNLYSDNFVLSQTYLYYYFKPICTTISGKREGYALYSVKGWEIPGLCYVVHLLRHEHYVPFSTPEWISVVETGPVTLLSLYQQQSCAVLIYIYLKGPWWCIATEISLPGSPGPRAILMLTNNLQPMKEQSKLKNVWAAVARRSTGSFPSAC